MQRDTRASNAEREAVIGKLQQAVGEGHITLAQFEERAQAAFCGRTRGDLDVLIADLPRSIW